MTVYRLNCKNISNAPGQQSHTT